MSHDDEQNRAAGAEIVQAERSSQSVVALIRRTVTAIRSINAFPPSPHAQGGRASTSATKRAAESLVDVRLMPVFQEAGLTKDIASICDPATGISAIDIEATGEGEDDRHRVITNVCLPLLARLSECYEILDKMPQTEETQPQQTTNGAGRKRNAKPKAPEGLLSIADYTDIACLLEFLVCTSIHCNLESHVLPALDERVRFLPKSLGGRLNRRSLMWGNEIKQSSCKRTNESQNITALRQTTDELRQSSTAIAKVVTLERFRPMLLPRHSADIMAGMFQSDRLQEVISKHPNLDGGYIWNDVGYKAIRSIVVGFTGGGTDGSTAASIQPFDPHTRARAYQTLLSGGRKSPPWLRRKAGSLLNSLAASNLRCVVDVFVVAASSLPADDISVASARLGRVLCSVSFPNAQDVIHMAEFPEKGSNSYRYYERLFRQLALLLDIAAAASDWNTKINDINVNTEEQNIVDYDPRVVAGALTVWSVIDNAPLHVVEAFMLPILINGLVRLHKKPRLSSLPVHTSIKRLHMLFSFVPRTATAGVGKIYLLMFSPLRVYGNKPSSNTNDIFVNKITTFGQLVRVACTSEHNVVETSKTTKDALSVLRIIVHGIAARGVDVKVADVQGLRLRKALSVALVEAVCVNTLDVQGTSYRHTLKDGKYQVEVTESDPELNNLVLGMERRAKIVVVKIVTELFGSVEHDGHKDSEPSSDLPNLLFCLLLLVYFGGTGPSKGKETTLHKETLLPKSLQRHFESAKLVSMTMLPLCCEYCSPVTLILGTQSSSSAADNASNQSYGVLAMIKIIILSIASRYHDKTKQNSRSPSLSTKDVAEESVHDDTTCIRYVDCDISAVSQKGCFVTAVEIIDEDESHLNDAGNESNDDKETLLSIGSIVVSLLVAMLELGEESRLPDEEKVLSSLVPALEQLSSLSMNSSDCNNAISRLESETAEMASHAVALIYSRGMASFESPFKPPQGDGINEKIKQVEHDLCSDQPAIRARGIVTLRHVARGYIDQSRKLSDDRQDRSKPLIVEIAIDEKEEKCGENDALASIRVLQRLVGICIDALNDHESYVYLAAVQTLVAIADANPTEIMPLLGKAVSLGRIDFECLSSSNDSSSIEGPSDSTLSPSQRIKATEALLFAIKRRGDGLYLVGRELMDLMLYGGNIQSQTDGIDTSMKGGNIAKTIQTETVKFFKAADPLADDDDLQLEEEERRLRLNTGGPVFDAEEDDVVRAGCTSVVAALVSALPCGTLIRYCPSLVHLAKEILRLDASRPIRRSAALLSRELYSAIVREIDGVQGNDGDESFLLFAVAMVRCDEASLHAALEQCRSGDDGCSSVKGEVRLADPATMARCEEAMAIRASIEDMQLFAAAKMLVAAEKKQESDPAAQTILSRLRERKRNVDDEKDSLHAVMRGLEIDSDSLHFR